jgi:hypothetical protein
MESFCGTEGEFEYTVEWYYANDGWWVVQDYSTETQWTQCLDFHTDISIHTRFIPRQCLLFEERLCYHMQGIHYHKPFSADLVVVNSKLRPLTHSEGDEETPKILERRPRAQSSAKT